MLSETGFQAGPIRLASLSKHNPDKPLLGSARPPAVDLPIRAATLMGVWALDALGSLLQPLNRPDSGQHETPDLSTLVRQLEREILDPEEPENSEDVSRYHAPPLA